MNRTAVGTIGIEAQDQNLGLITTPEAMQAAMEVSRYLLEGRIGQISKRAVSLSNRMASRLVAGSALAHYVSKTPSKTANSFID